MAELSLDNIFTSEEANNLFVDDDVSNEDTGQTNPEEKENKETTEVNPEQLFSDSPESVGSDEDNKEQEDTESTKDGTSPDFYSSIAQALVEDGVFQDLDSDKLDQIKTADDFKELIENQIEARFDERTRRINAALNNDVSSDAIRYYENTLSQLNSISDELLSEESETAETLRKNLIYQDFINRGYSKEKADKEVKKSLDNGSDIEDAKDALQGNIEFFTNTYNSLLEDAAWQQKELQEQQQKQAEELKNSIMTDKKIFGGVDIDVNTRRKAYDNIAKPAYQDTETGEYLTELQKYQRENNLEFIKNVGILYTLTNGFKDINKLVGREVNKSVKKGIRELEDKLSNMPRSSDGSLQYMQGSDDPESWLKNYSIDV